jgi:hypothetical protein
MRESLVVEPADARLHEREYASGRGADVHAAVDVVHAAADDHGVEHRAAEALRLDGQAE